MEAALPGRLVAGCETLGTRSLHRRILPFRFEIQLVEGAETLRFLHRETAAPERRERDRAGFEALLARLADPVVDPA